MSLICIRAEDRKSTGNGAYTRDVAVLCCSVAATVKGDVVRFRWTSVFPGPGLVRAWHPKGGVADGHCTGSRLRLLPILALPLTISVTLSKLQASPVHGMRTTRCPPLG